jgi:competence CoiA-like predicted nuclease
MLYALNSENQKIRAYPKGRGVCPLCGSDMIAKCGKIIIWHWAHKELTKCDSFRESETEWHRGWKSDIVPECCEVILENWIDGELEERHIADIRNDNGTVIELQHSRINVYDIGIREIFYKDMVWVLDAIQFRKHLTFYKKENYFSFKWKYPWKSFWDADKPIFLHVGENIIIKRQVGTKWKDAWGGGSYEVADYIDLPLGDGDFLFEIKRVYRKTPTTGWGNFITREEFLKRFQVRMIQQ